MAKMLLMVGKKCIFMLFIGQTPLCNAILGQHLPTTTYLIEHGANLTLADNKGYTALHCAAEKGQSCLYNFLSTFYYEM